jgi:hypothetical protein
MTSVYSAERVLANQVLGALAYEAPYLTEKLLKEHIVETSDEGEALFNEVKKYLVLVRLNEDCFWNMYSLRIDEVWHQFILFTNQYVVFCQRFFGRHIPHAPSNAPKSPSENSVVTASFNQFQDCYQGLFGTPLPDLWYDERNVTIRSRVINDQMGKLRLRERKGMSEYLSQNGDVLFSVNDFAKESLAFIVSTGAFYVRELPGDHLTNDEKVALISALIECKILRSAP